MRTALESRGFDCQVDTLGSGDAATDNLYARRGHSISTGKRLLFLGHLDVVPVAAKGEKENSIHQYQAEISDGILWGRGTVDMKGAIACFIAAVDALDAAMPRQEQPEICILLTGDEEGVATYGTNPFVQSLVAAGAAWDGCITGEPTSVLTIGDTAKHGRRGSMLFKLEAHGKAGHVGYPHQAANAAQYLADAIAWIGQWRPDDGDADFEPSALSVTDIGVGNSARNVIPGTANAHFACRFGTAHTPESLVQGLRDHLLAGGFALSATAQDNTCHLLLHHRLSSSPFITEADSPFIQMVQDAVASVTHQPCAMRTTGGTSDSRFLRRYCPVVDLGLCNATMHGDKEHVPLADLDTLTAIYLAILRH